MFKPVPDEPDAFDPTPDALWILREDLPLLTEVLRFRAFDATVSTDSAVGAGGGGGGKGGVGAGVDGLLPMSLSCVLLF